MLLPAGSDACRRVGYCAGHFRPQAAVTTTGGRCGDVPLDGSRGNVSTESDSAPPQRNHTMEIRILDEVRSVLLRQDQRSDDGDLDQIRGFDVAE